MFTNSAEAESLNIKTYVKSVLVNLLVYTSGLSFCDNAGPDPEDTH